MMIMMTIHHADVVQRRRRRLSPSVHIQSYTMTFHTAHLYIYIYRSIYVSEKQKKNMRAIGI